MAKKIQKLSDTSNVGIMNAIRNSNGTDYASRVTEATQGALRETAAQIMSHRPSYNAFVDALINRIGSVVVRNNSWTNPLAEFKRGMLEFGDTIEEVQVGLVKSKAYNADRDYLEKDIFGSEPPHVEANFHTVNRREYYKITVKENDLRDAFLSSDGLYSFINAVLDSPVTSDNWDEFLIMCSLFAQYEANGGYYRVNVPDARGLSAGGDDARQVIKKVRTMAENLTFMSTKYNAAGMPVVAKRDDLVLFTTPEFNATVDVDALAGAFNMERSTLAGRQISIPSEHFGLDGAQAILTTKDFFVMADHTLENTSADNPVGLSKNYFLHHHSVISQSRFAPAILFHTGADDAEPIVIYGVDDVSDIELTYYNTGETVTGGVPRGAKIQATAQATRDGEPAPTMPAVRWTITGNVDPRTRITNHGVVHVGGRETATSLEVKATAVFIDPEKPNGKEVTKTTTVTVDLDSPHIPAWPVERDEPTDYDDEPVEDDAGGEPAVAQTTDQGTAKDDGKKTT